MKLLFLHPGQLSLEWSEGKRMRYVPPFRLYLIASFIVFLLFGMTRGLSMGEVHGPQVATPEVSEELTKAINEAEKEGSWFIATGLRGINEAMEDPDGYFRKIKGNLPKTAFLLLPVFGLLHSLVEIRKRKFIIDYLVFSLHLHAFVFSLIALILLLSAISEPLGKFAQVLNLAIPVYTVLGIRRFNAQGLLLSILKALLVMAAYLVILGMITAAYFTFFLFI